MNLKEIILACASMTVAVTVGMYEKYKMSPFDYALQELKTFEPCKKPTIEPLTGGAQGNVYKISCPKNSYVIKVITNATTAQREIYFTELMNRQGMTPHIYATNTKHAYIIMEYIDPTVKLAGSLEEQIKVYAKTIKKMHAISCDDRSEQPFTSKELEQQLGKAKATITKNGIDYKALTQAVNTIQSQTTTLHKGLCHGDLNFLNFLVQNSALKIIDFEGMHYGDIFLDLGTIFAMSYKDLTTAQRLLFLDEYFGRPLTPGEQKQLKLMTLRAFIFYGSIIIQKSKNRDEGILLLKNALRFYEEYKNGNMEL